MTNSSAADGEDPTVMLTSRPHSVGHDVLPILPEFELQGELGRGGMGIVYKATRKSDRQVVAIKVIRKDRLQHDESVRRFRREAQAASRLNHPNIVHVFDSDHVGDVHYLVMEYVAGSTLERFVEQNGPIPYPLAIDFLRQAALGLEHAHEQGLVHRDIKPSNIMVVPASGRMDDGSPARVKVLDMGVARVLQSEHHPGEALTTLTQGGSVIGTADYVAPEQLEDPHGADIRADLYSLGCTVYFMLIGEVPFPGGSLISKLDKQRWQIPPAVNIRRPEIPEAVAGVVARLIAKKPAERYQTPTDLLLSLAELTASNFARSRPPGPEPREVKAMAGHSGLVWCVASSADGSRAATSGKDQTIRVWDLSAGECLRQIPRLPQEVRAVAFSFAGDRLAAAVGVSIRVYDIATGAEVQRLSGHSAAIRCLAFAPNDRWLYSAGDDKTLRVWDLQASREGQRFTKHTAPVTCLTVAPDGDSVLSGSRDQSMRRWDLRSGQESNVWTSDGGPVLAVALSNDGRHAASAHFDTSLRLWNLGETPPVGELQGHKQMVTGVGFFPDGKSLVSVSQDRTIRWWDVATGRQLGMYETGGVGLHALAMVPSSHRVLAAAADGSLRLIEFPQ